MKNLRKKGISLIVLVITIIVMIILATAIILSLNSSNIVEKAKEAKTASDMANAKNVVAVALGEWELMTSAERAKYDNFAEYAETKLQETGYKVDENGGLNVSSNGVVSTIYVGADNRQAIIPEGFTVSTKATEDSVTEGLVISDSKGNEFVWVPVDDFENNFKRTTTYDGTITDPGSDYTEPFSKTTSAGITLSLTNDLTGEWAEYAAMRASVEENKGFYIGRYETGTTSARTNIANGTTDVLVQKGKPVYNYVGWGPSMTSASGDVTYSSKNQGKGAVELSRNMYKGSSSVVSTLCYGVQWDAALQFMYNTDNTYPTNSTDKGNYTGTLANTGSSDDYAVNNIYDMAGNLYEWTMESSDINTRIVRGGYYYLEGDYFSAYNRDDVLSPGSLENYIGFRVSLYIK